MLLLLLFIIIYPICQNDRVAPKGMACTRVLPSKYITKNTIQYINDKTQYNDIRQLATVNIKRKKTIQVQLLE